MSFTSAIYTSMSALDAAGTGISAVGNNLANVDTTGFKESQVQFGDVLNSVLGQTSPDNIGSGVDVQAVTTQFTDGTIQNTSNPLDFAISGNGFFTVNDVNQNNRILYTRAGAFSLDKSGNIVDANGDILQGYMAGASGNITNTLTNLTLPLDANGNMTTPAQATANVTLSLNLDPADSLPTLDWATANNGPNFATNGPAAGSYNFSTAVNVLDSAGNSHLVNIYFAKAVSQNTPASPVSGSDISGNFEQIPISAALGNNTITYTDGNGNACTATIPDGNYTTANIANIVQGALNTADNAFGNNTSFTVGYGAGTGLTVTNNNVATSVTNLAGNALTAAGLGNAFPATISAGATQDGGVIAGNFDTFAITAALGNNTIVFNDGTVSRTATIADGNYTAATIAGAVQAALNSATAADGTATTNTFSVDYGVTQPNELSITNTSGPTAVTMFNSGTTANNLGFSQTLVQGSPETWTPDSWNAYAVWDAGKFVPNANAAAATGTAAATNGTMTVNYMQQQLPGLDFTTTTDPTTGATTTTLGNGTAPVTLTWDPAWGAATSQAVSIDFSKSTQYGSPDSVVFQSTDGYTAGGLTGFNMEQNGTLEGQYSNGQDKALAQVVLTQFNAETQLARAGNNLFSATYGSGPGTLVTPGTAGAGTISGDALESSNVNEADQFQEMIALQSAFSLNSTVMKTVNDEYTNLINIKT